ncbi:MAG: hypothetical protein LBR26_04995 [Prevotella sp.]|jgi:hypothetical protein|nr:hypothetical protein [Prevotella sp.]
MAPCGFAACDNAPERQSQKPLKYVALFDFKDGLSDEQGNEFWLARELAPVLEYTKRENFKKVIGRAMLACKNSGFSISDQFLEVRKLVEMPSKPQKGGQLGFADFSKTKKVIIINFSSCWANNSNQYRS